MYRPYISDDDSKTEGFASGSNTRSGSFSGSSVDGQMEAIAQWQAAVRLPQPERTRAQETMPSDISANTRLEFEQVTRTHVVMLDSLDRDQHVYPSPTQLRLKLPRVYKNVERIDIVQIKFFCGIYAISEARKNHSLWLSDASGTREIRLSDGTYTLTQLTATLAARLNASAPIVYGVDYNSVTGRITISASGTFSILFKSKLPVYNKGRYSEWGLGWILGWGGQPTDLSGAQTYTADHFPRLLDDYIYLQLNETEHMNEIDHTAVEVTSMAQDSTGQVAHYFGKLLLNHFGCWAQTFIEAPKMFKPVLGRLERLNLTWTDRHGVALTGVDANSCDWHMTVRITEIVDVPTANSSLP